MRVDVHGCREISMAHYLLNELDIICAFTESGAESMSEVMHGKMRQQIRRTVFQLGLIHFFGIVGKRDALNGSIDIMGAEKVSSTVTKYWPSGATY